MAVTVAQVLHGIKIGSDFYSQVEGADPTVSSQGHDVIPVGHFEPLFTATSEEKFSVGFKCTQLATAFAAFGQLGFDASGAILRYRGIDDLGDRITDATTTHELGTMAKAFGYMTSISGDHRGLVSADFVLTPVGDGGTTQPIVWSTAANAETPTAAENYALGTVKVNGSAVEGATTFNVSYNPELYEIGDKSDIHDSFIGLKSIKPVVTVGFTKKSVAQDLHDTKITALEIQLRKYDADGDFIANVTASHITLTFTASAGGRSLLSNISGDPAVTNLMMPLRAPSATARALTITVDTALT